MPIVPWYYPWFTFLYSTDNNVFLTKLFGYSVTLLVLRGKIQPTTPKFQHFLPYKKTFTYDVSHLEARPRRGNHIRCGCFPGNNNMAAASSCLRYAYAYGRQTHVNYPDATVQRGAPEE